MHSQKSFQLLPNESYYSESWFEKEKKLIFEKTWQFAGLDEDLQNPGDYLTVQCGNISLIVIKDENKDLHAFHNICRHRGMQLLKGHGKIEKNITCPYHNWKYNIYGKLKGIPFKSKEFPELSLNKTCLHKASVTKWRNMIWVHPEPKTRPFSEWVINCQNHIGPHLPQRLVEYPESIYEKTVKANWKIIAENFMDVYHLSQLHANTLNMYDHKKAKYKFINEHFMFWEPLAEKYQQNLEILIPYKRIKEVSNNLLGAYAPWFFPNFGLAECESSWSTFHLIPLSPESTKLVIRTKLEEMTGREYYSQQKNSNNNWYKIMGGQPLNSENGDPLLSGDFMAEDIYVCEQIQKSVKNPYYKPIFSKNMEVGLKGFHQNILEWLNK